MFFLTVNLFVRFTEIKRFLKIVNYNDTFFSQDLFSSDCIIHSQKEKKNSHLVIVNESINEHCKDLVLFFGQVPDTCRRLRDVLEHSLSEHVRCNANGDEDE